MATFKDTMEKHENSIKKLEIEYDQELLHKVAKGLGPSIYNNDSAKVSTSSKSEMESIKKNFLIKKLGLSEEDKLDEAIEEVAEQLGHSNRNKYRTVFYYMLVKKFGKEDVYNK